MHAVIRTGGKQYRVAEGDILRVEKLDGEAGDTIDIADVLLISDGDNAQIGTPLLDGKAVSAEIVKHARADKIEVIKFKRRKKYRRTHGHRQHYTQLKITSIPGA
ncbi:50S ribosomal protein L21 [Salinisphaera sp. T31B1]|uniref:50S ribosomal protein L21 n=1 Tax=Salinisphaera sp. T31B1 TaxID=727963 RepID=UPI00333EA4BA